ncbi:MAG: hypothetical protein O7E57_11765 [Gammaproteobacteria bacterium]|nr:hypothetical protein [Gammaproteobacteria bacterium]
MRTRSLLLGVGALTLTAGFSMSASAEIVARWDEQGIAHFGNLQFAPRDPKAVKLLEVQPTNGMVAAQATAKPNRSPRFTFIKKRAKSNQRGWRGNKKQGSARGSRR